jgi:hypothetical protein
MGIHTVKDLQKITIQDFRGIRGLGETKIADALTLLKEAGITLPD